MYVLGTNHPGNLGFKPLIGSLSGIRLCREKVSRQWGYDYGSSIKALFTACPGHPLRAPPVVQTFVA